MERPCTVRASGRYCDQDRERKSLWHRIEVGGSGADTNANGVVDDGEAGSYYKVKSSGHTDPALSTNSATRVAGSIWLTSVVDGNTGWIAGNPFGPAKVQLTDSGLPGTQVGMADLIFSLSKIGVHHSAIELSFDASFMGSDKIIEVS